MTLNVAGHSLIYAVMKEPKVRLQLVSQVVPIIIIVSILEYPDVWTSFGM